jgi:hypothetical protein
MSRPIAAARSAPPPGSAPFHVLSPEVLHHHERGALVGTCRVDGHDVRVVHRGGDPRLALEPGDVARVRQHVLVHDLYRDGPAGELLVVRQPDFPHAPGADPPDQLVPLTEVGHARPCYPAAPPARCRE